MIITNPIFNEMLGSPMRQFKGRVEVYEGSTLTLICGCHDNLISFMVERAGEQDKFFGYGICQRLTVKLLDRDRQLNINKNNRLEVSFGVGTEYVYPCPVFFVEEITRDEKTNELTVVAYDALYVATKHTVSELSLTENYTIKQFALACSALLGMPIAGLDYEVFDTLYPEGANFDGTENIREALNFIAQATQTVYFVDKNWNLTFRRLDVDGEPVATIDKSKYMELSQKKTAVLANVAHITELGDNIITTSGVQGYTQYVRNNPFWDMREDIGTIVDNALAVVAGLSITGFDCSWRGNFLLEICDKINLITKDDDIITSYVLNDSFTFNGGLSAKMSWDYSDNSQETHANPTSLGEVIKQTYARVDKAKQEIELLAKRADENEAVVSTLLIDTNGINAAVSKLQTATDDAFDSMNDSLTTLTTKVNATMTSEDIKLEISKEIANGTATKVATSTGFTFDEKGLTVEEDGSEIKTTVSKDGMTVYKNNDEVLVANNQGVKAVNLRASTYLIIGETSRLEDSEDKKRTCCYWIGG